MKTTHKHKKKSSIIFQAKKKDNKLFVIGIISLVFLSICGFLLYKLFLSQTKAVIETPKYEMKKLPADVKKQLVKQTTFASPSATLRIPILLYHYVEYVQDKKDKMRQSLNITPDVFESQVKTLSDAGYTFMTAKEVGEVLDGKISLPSNPIVLTFDDGHWDVDTDILPILKKYHAKATAYIISGFIGGSDFLSQTQLQDIINSGLVDIGAHTVHHIALRGKLLPIVQYEVNQSKASLEQTYHISVVSFAYPDGSFDVQSINTVKDAGFTTSVSTIPGVEENQQNRYFLYRIRPGYRTGEELLHYLKQTTFKPW